MLQSTQEKSDASSTDNTFKTLKIMPEFSCSLFTMLLIVGCAVNMLQTLWLLGYLKNRSKLSSLSESQKIQFVGQFTPLSRSLMGWEAIPTNSLHIFFFSAFGGILSL